MTSTAKCELELHGRLHVIVAKTQADADKAADILRRAYEEADGPDRCTGRVGYQQFPCRARRGFPDTHCGEPCSFIMDYGRHTSETKTLLGEVLDFLTGNDIVIGIRK